MSTVTLLKDDVDGGMEGVKSHTFSIDGRTYEIDVADHNWEAFTDVIKAFKAKSRETTKAAAVPRQKGPGALSDVKIKEIREWAAAHDVALPARGRIPAAIVAQHQASLEVAAFPRKAKVG